jgi:hypothetical protein
VVVVTLCGASRSDRQSSPEGARFGEQQRLDLMMLLPAEAAEVIADILKGSIDHRGPISDCGDGCAATSCIAKCLSCCEDSCRDDQEGLENCQRACEKESI